jgi:hypothetical protein
VSQGNCDPTTSWFRNLRLDQRPLGSKLEFMQQTKVLRSIWKYIAFVWPSIASNFVIHCSRSLLEASSTRIQGALPRRGVSTMRPRKVSCPSDLVDAPGNQELSDDDFGDCTKRADRPRLRQTGCPQWE